MGIGRGNDRRSSAERRRTLRVIEEALALRNGVYRALLRGCSARCDKNARAKIAAPSRRQCSANFLQSGRSPPCVIPASMEEHHGASSTALAAISEDTRCRSAARSFPAHPRKASLLRARPHFPQAGRPRRLVARPPPPLGRPLPTARPPP